MRDKSIHQPEHHNIKPDHFKELFALFDVLPEIRILKITISQIFMHRNRLISCFESPIIHHHPQASRRTIQINPPRQGMGSQTTQAYQNIDLLPLAARTI